MKLLYLILLRMSVYSCSSIRVSDISPINHLTKTYTMLSKMFYYRALTLVIG